MGNLPSKTVFFSNPNVGSLTRIQEIVTKSWWGSIRGPIMMLIIFGISLVFSLTSTSYHSPTLGSCRCSGMPQALNFAMKVACASTIGDDLCIAGKLRNDLGANFDTDIDAFQNLQQGSGHSCCRMFTTKFGQLCQFHPVSTTLVAQRSTS